MEIGRAPLPRQPGGPQQDRDELQASGSGHGSAPAGQVYDVASMPGFRFQPTEEELVGFYLRSIVVGKPHLEVELINMLDLYRYDPWELPALAFLQGEREWLFFCPRDKKYPNGARPNRVTASGYWKATGTDRQVRRALDARCIGLKKTLVFYTGKAPKGRKTEWIMNEYRLPQHEQHLRSSANLSDPREVALCRIYKKPASNPSAAASLGLCAEFMMESESSPAAVAVEPNSKILHTTSTSEQQPFEAIRIHDHRINSAILLPETNPIQQEPPPIQTSGSRSAKAATGTLASMLYPSQAGAPAEGNGDSIDALLTQMMEAEARRSRPTGPHFLYSPPGTQIRVASPDVANTPRSLQEFALPGEVVGATSPAMASLDRLLKASTMRSTAPHDDHLSLFWNQFGWNFGTTSQPPRLNYCTLPARPSLLHIQGRQGHFQ